MPKRTYSQAKRQREASREDKKAQKMQRKLDRLNARSEDAPPAESATAELPPED